MSRFAQFGALFEQPHKWTRHHRDLLQVKTSLVSSEKLVGSAFLPQDGDREFETVVADFAGPTRESFLDGTVWFDYKRSPFWCVFSSLRAMICLEERAGDESRNEACLLARPLIDSLFDVVLGLVNLNTWFVSLAYPKIHFHIESCNVKGVLKPAGAISRGDDAINKTELPLITFSVINPRKMSPDIISHEIPQFLIQAILMFQKNPTLEAHTAFALRIEGIKLQFSSAVISQTYIRSLSHGNPLIEDLTFLHSVTYDLRESDQRREVLRLIIGLFRCLDATRC